MQSAKALAEKALEFLTSPSLTLISGIVALFNRQSRELKLKFSEKKDDIQHKLDSRQVFLTVEIEKLRNERSYWIAVLKKTEDIDALKNCRDQIDLLTLRMGDLEQRKVDLDRERKATINILKREYYEQVAALEAQYSQEGGKA